MIEYILTIVILLGVGVYYKFYYAPKKALDWYKRTIEGLGYKVKLFPFQIFGCPYYGSFVRNEQEFNDPLYETKNQFPKYDVGLYNLFEKPVVTIYNAELTKSFFLPDNIYVHYKMKSITQNVQRSLGMGIAFSEGKQWKRKKQIISAVFNYDFIIQIIPKINRICDDALNEYEKQCKQSGQYEQKDEKQIYRVKVVEIFAKAFSNVIIQCFFGMVSLNQKIKDHSAAKFINTLNSDLNQQTFSLPVLLFGIKFAELGLRKFDRSINQRVKILRQFGKKLIEKRLQEIQKNGVQQKYQDIVEALVFKKSFKRDNENVPNIKNQLVNSYDFKQLIQQFCTFFTGGTQTTANFTQMMIYLISKDKRIQDKLRHQIDSIIKTNEDITKDNLKKLYYIDWIQNQTTRLYGPGNGLFTRISQKDHYIGNIPILKGTAIDINPTPSHYNELYYKNPHQFRPERWQNQCENNHPFAFLGFSAGPRTCIGKHLALLESKIGLIKFMKRYKQIHLPKQDFKMRMRFLYEPEPMRLQVSK